MSGTGLEEPFRRSLEALSIPAVPVALPTPWPVGPVMVFLFPGPPVTLLDCGVDGPESHQTLERRLAAHGVGVEDVEQVIVTHGHGDHFGAARWLQERSGCDVYLHELDAERLRDPWDVEGLLRSLGVPDDEVVRLVRKRTRVLPELKELRGGESIRAGGRWLRVVHTPGHSPGHVLVMDDASGAAFLGDYLLSMDSTNPGLDVDLHAPNGRRSMLRLYEEGLQTIVDLRPPAGYPSHGPPIEDPAALAERRLSQSENRTQRVLRALVRAGTSSPYALALTMFGRRIARNLFEFLADVSGRLDLLVERGRATACVVEGVWLFDAAISDI